VNSHGNVISQEVCHAKCGSRPAVWIFRWRENATEGRVYRRCCGYIEQFPTKTAANVPLNISLHDQRGQSRSARDLRQLVKHYEENELPKQAFSTQRTPASLRLGFFPSGANTGLQTCAQWKWKAGFTACHCERDKGEDQNTMHVIFAHAGRHEWIVRRSYDAWRQSAKREKLPDVLELDD